MQKKKKEYYFTAFKFQDWKLDKEFSLKSWFISEG